MRKLTFPLFFALLIVSCEKTITDFTTFPDYSSPPPITDTINTVVLIPFDWNVDYYSDPFNQIQNVLFGRIASIPGPFTTSDTVLNEYEGLPPMSTGMRVFYLGAIPLINPDSVKGHGKYSITFAADSQLYNKPLFEVVYHPPLAVWDTTYHKIFVMKGPAEINVGITSADSRPSDAQAAECYNNMILRGDTAPAELWGTFQLKH